MILIFVETLCNNFLNCRKESIFAYNATIFKNGGTFNLPCNFEKVLHFVFADDDMKGFDIILRIKIITAFYVDFNITTKNVQQCSEFKFYSEVVSLIDIN